MRAAAVALALSACYSGVRASRDIDAAWRGHSRAELEARWGRPADESHEDQTYLRFTHVHEQVELPGGSAAFSSGPRHAEGFVEVHAGAIWHTTTDAIAAVDPSGTIVDLRGHSVEWGPPEGANLHWGAIFGAHVGMGRLDDTGTPLPSGGLYIGGMLDPHLGLVGTYSFVSGNADAGSSIGMAAGIGAQYFESDRLALRAGPAAILWWSPGFSDTHATGGLDGSAAYAIVRAGTFALDLRLDVVAGPGVAFGSIGVGVNRD
jgi:hypothetical protein